MQATHNLVLTSLKMTYLLHFLAENEAMHKPQTHYTTTEHELLAIVKTLKEFCSILLRQMITVYTDHNNLTYKNFNTKCIMHWHLILEEYGPELIYIPHEQNTVAYALSHLDKLQDEEICSFENIFDISNEIGENLDEVDYPLDL